MPNRNTTMLDVSLKAGVSTATVSRVMNNPGIVEIETRSLVEKAISELGYRPNSIARGLASRSTNAIGVVINQFASPYFGEILDGFLSAIRETQFKMVVESSLQTAIGEREALESLIDRQCDVIVLHTDRLSSAELNDTMTNNDNVILVNRCLEGFEPRCVYLDNHLGGQLAAKHLIANGHTEIAMVTGPQSFVVVRERTAGFLDELKRQNLSIHPNLLIESSFSANNGKETLETLLAHRHRFTAIFYQNDDMAAEAMETCRKLGLRIPEDLSILGFDGSPIGKYVRPGLTTVRQPLREIGQSAGRLAHALASNESGKDIQTIFQPEILDRGSVMPLHL